MSQCDIDIVPDVILCNREWQIVPSLQSQAMHARMGRWEPNARERLQEAAMALFLERGYDRTSVGDIATRAKLAPRTFFRYFSDKREVLFSGTEALEALITEAIERAPKALAPLEVVALGLAATSPMFEARRGVAQKRQALIVAHGELRERELSKSTQLAGAIFASLRARGVVEAAAKLLSMTAMILYQTAYERWAEDAEKRDLAHHVRASLAELRRLTARRTAAKPRREAK